MGWGRRVSEIGSRGSPDARRAVAFAQRAINTVGELGLVIRVGVHTGEVELVRDKLEGVAVQVGARTTAGARPSEVLVSGIVKTSRWQLSAARLSERARIGLAP
jgi:class 3 adenylate cyclase